MAVKTAYPVVGADFVVADGPEEGFHGAIDVNGKTYVFSAEVFSSPDSAASYARGVAEGFTRNIDAQIHSLTGWILKKNLDTLNEALQA